MLMMYSSDDESSSAPTTVPAARLLSEFNVQEEALRLAQEELAAWNSEKDVSADFLSGKHLKWNVFVGGQWVTYDKSVHGSLRHHTKKVKVTDDKEFNVLDHLREAADRTRRVVDDGTSTPVRIFCL